MPGELTHAQRPELLLNAAPETGAGAAQDFLARLRGHFDAATNQLLAAPDEATLADTLRALLARALLQRFAIGQGSVLSSSSKLDPTALWPVLIHDAQVNRPLLVAPEATGYPIEVVYAAIGVIDILTPESATSALERIATLRRMARRGKFYTSYVRLDKPSGKTVVTQRELREEAEPRTYLVARDVGAGKGKLDRPDGLAKALKDLVGDMKDDARLHGLAVLRRDWFLFQPTYKKRLEWTDRDALLDLVRKIGIDLHDYPMWPMALDRYRRHEG